MFLKVEFCSAVPTSAKPLSFVHPQHSTSVVMPGWPLLTMFCPALGCPLVPSVILQYKKCRINACWWTSLRSGAYLSQHLSWKHVLPVPTFPGCSSPTLHSHSTLYIPNWTTKPQLYQLYYWKDHLVYTPPSADFTAETQSCDLYKFSSEVITQRGQEPMCLTLSPVLPSPCGS